MERRAWLRGLACLPGVLLGTRGSRVQADDSSADKARAEAEEAGRLATGEVAHWEFWLREPIRTRLDLATKPVLRWTNPGSGRVYGSVFVAPAEGRPEAVFAVYKWYDPWHGFEAEMQSLSSSGLDATRDGRDVWHPSRRGIEMREVPDAPAPADSHAGRRRQIGPLAARVSAHLIKTREGQKDEPLALRLLTKPIHHFQGEGPDAPFGGLFAFVQGTDPELFLLIEARPAGSAPRWRYGLARMSRAPLRAEIDGREVWSVPQIDGRHDREGTYFNMDLPQPSPSP